MNPKDVLKLAKEKGAKIVDLRFIDLPGLWQHFSIPIAELSAELFAEGIGRVFATHPPLVERIREIDPRFGSWADIRRLGKRGGSAASAIKFRRSISERAVDVTDRATPGHWEADFMLFARYGQGLLIAHERQSRYTIIDHPPDRKAERTAKRLVKLLEPLPPPASISTCLLRWRL